MSSIRAHFFLLCGILLFAGSASAQNLLTNGSFEDPPFSAGTANYPLPSIPGWTSTADFEVWNQLQGPAADGNQYLEMDVSTCTTISQTIPTSASRNYLVSLAFAARDGVADNRIEVLWNGTVIGTASADGSTQSGNVVWTHYAFPAQAGGTGSSTLQIRDVDACDGLGSLLDDVAVVQAPVPTPALGRAGFAQLAGGLILLALVLLRRRAI
jgi:hypothetical protein